MISEIESLMQRRAYGQQPVIAEQNARMVLKDFGGNTPTLRRRIQSV